MSKKYLILKGTIFLSFLLFLIQFISLQPGQAQEQKGLDIELQNRFNEAQSLEDGETLSHPGFEVVLEASTQYRPFYVAPPSEIKLEDYVNGLIPQTTTFVINYNPSSCNNAITDWPNDARAAFNYAAAIWSVLLNGTRTIEIDACWRTDMPNNILGSAGATTFYTNFSGAPIANTWYHVALANQLSNSDLNGGTAEITANFNSNFTWYFGLDGNPDASEYDFVTVILHEIGHGVGFSGSMDFDNGIGNAECNGTNGFGCWGTGSSGNPMAYDRFTENDSGNALISFNNPSIALGNQLISNNIFFDGPNATSSNGGTPPRLYAPDPWNGGSSYHHLNEATFNGTINALMTFALDFGEALHHPGPVALSILRDTGWTTINLSSVYVEAGFTGTELGTSTNPFNTVTEGIHAVRDDGTILIRDGSYNETITINRPMTLRLAGNGVVTIGQ